MYLHFQFCKCTFPATSHVIFTLYFWEEDNLEDTVMWPCLKLPPRISRG